VIRLPVGKQLPKVVLLATALLIVIPSVSLAIYGGTNYYQARNLVAEADSLVKVEKFDQAIEKYALAEAKWSSKSLKDEINDSLEEVQELKEEKDNYEKGIKYYDEEKWESAKETFEKISETSKYHEEVQGKMVTIEEKIKTGEYVKTKVRGTKTTSSSVAPTTSSTTNPNKDSICRNEAELYKIQEKNKAIAELKKQRPQLFYSEGEWKAAGFSSADLQYILPAYKNYYNIAMSMLENAAQQVYLIKYNECLQN